MMGPGMYAAYSPNVRMVTEKGPVSEPSLSSSSESDGFDAKTEAQTYGRCRAFRMKIVASKDSSSDGKPLTCTYVCLSLQPASPDLKGGSCV